MIIWIYIHTLSLANPFPFNNFIFNKFIVNFDNLLMLVLNIIVEWGQFGKISFSCGSESYRHKFVSLWQRKQAANEMQKKQKTRRGNDNRQRQRQLQFDERHQKFYDPLMNEPNKNYMPHKPDDWSRGRYRYSPKGQSEGQGKAEAEKGLPGKLRRSHYRHSLWLRM